MKSMTSYKKPTPEQVKKALSLTQTLVGRRRFFEGLHNPLWVRPLKEEGFFVEAPGPIRSEEEVRYPGWPELTYLRLVANNGGEEEKGVVAEVLASVDARENTLLILEILSVAPLLGPDGAMRIAKQHAPFVLTRQAGWGFGEAVSELAAYLIREGDRAYGLELATQLFAVLRTEGEKLDLYSEHGAFPIQAYEAGDVLGRLVPAIAAGQPLEPLSWLATVLETIVRAGEIEGMDDESFFWENAIDSDPEAHHLATVRESVTKSLIRVSEELAADEAMLFQVVAELDKHETDLFRRIRRHLIARSTFAPLSLVEAEVAAILGKPQGGTDDGSWAIAAAHWSRLSLELRESVLLLIETGMDEGRFRERHKAWYGTEQTDEEVAKAQDSWKSARLARLLSALTDTERRRFEPLLEGAAEYRQYEQEKPRGIFRPTSPFSADLLRALDNSALVTLLENWSPKEGEYWTDTDAIAEVWSELVTSDPQRFVPLLSETINFSSAHHWRTLHAIREAIKADTGNYPSDTILAYILAVADRFCSSDDVLSQSMSLLEAMMRAGSEYMPITNRETAWRVVKIAMKNERMNAPTTVSGDNIDWFTAALNSTGGSAFQLVMTYLEWLYNENKEMRAPEARDFFNLAFKSGSPLHAAMFGRFFPWITVYAKDWYEDNKSSFMSKNQSNQWREAFWTAHLQYSHFFDDIYLLVSESLNGVVDLSQSMPFSRNHAKELGDYLVLAYMRGLSHLQTGSPVILFLETAPPKVVRDVLATTGEQLGNDLQPVIIAKAVALWDAARTISETRAVNETVLRAFETWFPVKGLDADWRIEQLRALLDSSARVSDIMEIIDALGEYVRNQPRDVVETAGLIVERAEAHWQISVAKEALMELLLELQDVGQDTRTLRDKLVGLGFMEFARPIKSD